MNKAHSPINWENYPEKTTPINEGNLNKMDRAIGIIDDRVIEHEHNKLSKTDASSDIVNVEYNEDTSVFEFTKRNGDAKKIAISNVVVDDSLSETSTNPVQNKVVTKEIRHLSEDIEVLNQGGLNLKEDFIGEQVEKWLNEHPEATTTVQDGTLTFKKFILGSMGYVTPQNFGAVGNGITDDTKAFQDMFNYVNNTLLPIHIPTGKYRITADLPALFEGFSMYGVPFGNNDKTGSIILDERENTTTYLLRHDNTIANINGGAIKDIKIITNGERKLFGVYLTGGWDGIITDCTFSGYETALYTVGDEIRVTNCQFVFCGSKVESDEYNYGVVLKRANEKRFSNCHFEHSRFLVLITDSCWNNHFVNCKFEMGTVYSVINTDKSAIFVDSATSNYTATSFVDCDFHMLDIEFFIERVGFTDYNSTPFFMKSNNSCNVQISNCSFMCGHGSGDTKYKQFAQARYLKGRYMQVDNCSILEPSYIVSCIDVTNLCMNNCFLTVKEDGEYSAGNFSKDIPIITTEYGKCTNTFFNIMYKDIDKYYRLFNKNFDFTTPRNNSFNRGNELYSSTLYLVVDTHNANFAFPFSLSTSNKTSGNIYGMLSGRVNSWTDGILSNKNFNLSSDTVVKMYVVDTKLVFEISGYNSNAGSFISLDILKELPYDWYITEECDVTNAKYSIEVTNQ